ncbi:hypothetical protein E5288_WYG010388 [Bos mutus]|uniref:Uncharacterized protein n=1 Tax=Bos mutus TaxID=72004 RepID=A0A6B0RWG3_9CETA|nr:hypothetical protein [Bos mutus]
MAESVQKTEVRVCVVELGVWRQEYVSGSLTPDTEASRPLGAGRGLASPFTETPVHCREAGGRPFTPSTPRLQEPFEQQNSRLPRSPWTWKPVRASNQDAGPSPPPRCSVPRGPCAPICRRRTGSSPSQRKREDFDS